MKRSFISLAILLASCCGTIFSSSAKIKLPSFFSSNMVLQQESDIKLYGSSKALSLVTITTSWNNITNKIYSDSNGNWEVKIKTPKAGGPYNIKISDGEETILENILLGEVWFCSGQSNMEMPMKGFSSQPVKNSNDYLFKADPKRPIRIFNMDSKNGEWVRQYSKTPQKDCKGEWLVNSAENVANVSATGYLFAHYLQERLNVPVGIIVGSRGGSRVEAWMSREAITPFEKDIDLSILDNDQKITSDTNTPCILYNAKIAPFTEYRIKGFIWYQGESNIGGAEMYKKLIPAFVSDLRKKWNNDKLPFYFVEIAPFNYQDPNGDGAARLREAQLQNMKDIKNTGMVSTIDVGKPTFIHPNEKEVVGKRLAMWALAEAYGVKGFDYKSPIYKSMEIKEGKIHISTENVTNGLCPIGENLANFEIAGEDKKFYPANAQIDNDHGDCIIVWSEKVDKPIAVRYGFKNYSKGSVFTTSDLPLIPFRTDQW